jgi:hypothetical protein
MVNSKHGHSLQQKEGYECRRKVKMALQVKNLVVGERN